MIEASQIDCKIVLQGGTLSSDIDEFRLQVTEFLSGIVNHDGTLFFRHLKRELFAISILPGRVIDDYIEYVRFQEAWNNRVGAKWSYQLKQIHMYDSTHGFVLILAFYEDQGVDGKRFQRQIRIKDNFVREMGIWYLTENQNTVLGEARLDH